MKANTDLRSVDGQTIHLPQEKGGNVGAGNIALPNIYTEDSVQQYPIGTRFEMGERTFRYYKAGVAINYLLSGIASYDCRLGDTVNSYGTSQPAGVGTVANPLKVDGTSLALNHYAGHIAVIYVATTLGNVQMQVISSSASADDPLNAVETTELVLDQPTPMAIAADTGIDFFPSRFADCRTCKQSESGALNATYFPIVGIPMAIMTSGRWGWCLTKGPCFVVVGGTSPPGDGVADRDVIFLSDGSLQIHDEGGNSEQRAGYTLADTDGSGSEWIMLQCE